MTDDERIASLLAAAESTARELFTELPEARRYESLMVLKALTIARRRIAGGTLAEDGEDLSAAIRLGAFDAPSARRVAVHERLLRAVREELALVNPRFLVARDAAE